GSGSAGSVFLRRENKAISLSLTRGAGVPAGSELVDRRDLDQQFLLSCRVEAHVRDALGAFTRDGLHAALAEIVVADAVARGQLEVAVVTDLAGDLVREPVHGGGQRLERVARRQRLDAEAVSGSGSPVARSSRTSCVQGPGLRATARIH